MGIFVQQAFRLIAVMSMNFSQAKKLLLSMIVVMSALVMSACQTAPSSSTNPSTATTINKDTAANNIGIAQSDEIYQNTVDSGNSGNTDSDDDYPIEPYIPPTQSYPATETDYSSYEDDMDSDASYSSDDDLNPSDQSSPIYTSPLPPTVIDNPIIAQPPSLPSHSELLERARQNSQQQSRPSTSSSSDLPAFRNLMSVGTTQLQAGNLTAAENSFTRAQRLAPRSSAVYFYLSQVALKKNQPRKAEAMARRGLSVSRDANRRRALWQLILRSGQAQNNTRVIREAQQALR